MKNITVNVDDDTYRRARLRAAQEDTCVSALVRGFLQNPVSRESEAERMKREEAELCKQVIGFRASDRLDRDAVHERGV